MSPLLASLLHSLWIGLLCWLGARIVLRALPPSSAATRHAVVLGATVLLFVGWGGAWLFHRAYQETPTLAAVIVAEDSRDESVSPQTVAPTTVNTPTSVSTSIPTPQQTVSASATQRPAWLAEHLSELKRAATLQAGLELLWLAGAAYGLARLVYELHAGGSRWLGRQTTGVVPEVWLNAWRGRLEARARRLKTGLIAIEAAGAPMVVGLLKPMIVLPLASCAGISPELARAALAHELAHVARRDWLVELVLRVIEAVLFFNPFVWLLTSRVREEREACCDAWACAEAEIPRAEFATALAAWARLLTPVNPPQAHGLGLKNGLLGRVARLLGHRSTPRTRTWRGTVGVLALILLGLSAYGAFLQWGASALRDRERIALLEQAAAPYTTPDPWLPQPVSTARPERIVSGKVVTAEGAPLAGVELRFWAGDTRSESGTQTKPDGTFQSRRPLSGPTVIRVRNDGFAMRTVYVEASESEPREPIVLSEGISVPVRVLNAEGVPLPGALVHWALDVYGPRKSDQALTDAEGVAWVKHLPSDLPAYVRAEADGHATVGLGPLSADELGGKTPLEIRLPRGRTVTVRVVSEDDDKPLVGAHVRVDSLQPSWSPGANPHPSWNHGGLRTDEDGKVTLKHLRLDTSYRLQVEPRGEDRLGVLLASAPAVEQVVRYPEKWPVTVQLKGFPVQYRTSALALRIENGDEPRQHAIRLDPEGNARLSLSLLRNKSVVVELKDPRLEKLTVRAASAKALGETVVLDYADVPAEQRDAALRRVAIKFMHGGKEFFPSGRFYIHRLASPHVWDADGFTLEPNKPLFAEWPDGTRLKLTARWGLVGAVIDLDPEAAEKEIVIDARRTEIVVPVKPAGLVRAQARDADGNLVRDARLFGSTHDEIFSKRRTISFPGNQPLGEWQASEPVEFSLRGIPIWAAHGLVFARGPSASVSARSPVTDIVVTLPRTRVYEFWVTDENGRGLPGVACMMTGRFLEKKHASPPFGLVSRISDTDGRVRFEAGVDFQDWNGLQLLVETQGPGYARISTAIEVEKLKGTPRIVLKPAEKFRVRIVNRATGGGISGVEVEVHDRSTTRFTRAGRIISDADGWVEFNHLAADQKFRLGYSIPRIMGLRLAPEKDRALDPFRELTPADTGFVVFLEQEPSR